MSNGDFFVYETDPINISVTIILYFNSKQRHILETRLAMQGFYSKQRYCKKYVSKNPVILNRLVMLSTVYYVEEKISN